jgi:hypothetical protein
MRPVAPKMAPRPWVAAPPIRPWITFPRPKLILGLPISALNCNVDTRLNWILPSILEIESVSRLKPEIVETSKYIVLISVAFKVDVYIACVLIWSEAFKVTQEIFGMLIVALEPPGPTGTWMLLTYKTGVLTQSRAVKLDPAEVVLDTKLTTSKVEIDALSMNTLSEYIFIDPGNGPLVIYPTAPELPDVVVPPNIWRPLTAMSS